MATTHRAIRCELPEDETERVRATELVASVARDDECALCIDAATENTKDVETCLVRPVHVLEHEDRRPPRGRRRMSSSATSYGLAPR